MHRLEDGYYGLEVYRAYTTLDGAAMTEDEQARVPEWMASGIREVLNDLAQVSDGSAYVQVTDDEFILLHKLPYGGVIAMLGYIASRSETPQEAFSKAALMVSDVKETIVIRHIVFPDERIRPPARH